jgi:hypothetical protein
MSFSCQFCTKVFEKGTSLGGHIPKCSKNPSFKPKERIKKTEHICECGKSFDSGIKLGGHRVTCKSNPNNQITRDKIGAFNSGKSRSDEHAAKVSKAIQTKIQNGTWHLSFSKSRTHYYKGVALHGLWEVAYAKWLDDNSIKWRRPTEKFPYEYEGRTRYYTPDFYLEDQCIYVEIKGYPTSKDIAKWEAFPIALEILSGKVLFDMKVISEYKRINFNYRNISWK